MKRLSVSRLDAALFGLTPIILAAGILAVPTVTARNDSGTWNVCLHVGFLVEYYQCWQIGGPRPMPPPDTPECGTFVGPCNQ